jgi:hypothetical protein
VLQLSVIKKKRQKIIKEKDRYVDTFEFPFVGTPFGIQSVIKENTDINIRKLPFFPIEEDYQSIYPDESRKKMLLEQATAIKRVLDEADKVKIRFSPSSYKMFFVRAATPLILSEFASSRTNYDHSVTVIVPRNRPIPEIQKFTDKNCHENFIQLISDFYHMIELICEKGNGYYMSD